MPVTKKDLEDMMTRQKEERVAEMEMLKKIFMEGVKEHVKEQLVAVREEISEELTTVRNELHEKVEDLEKKHNEASDVQSVFDCRMDKIEEQIKTLKEVIKTEDELETTTTIASSSFEAKAAEETTKLIEYASKVVGFKPIERRDILRVIRDTKNSIENEEEAKHECLREFLRCELRMPVKIVNELLENIVKVWTDDDQDWDKLYVEFQDVKSVKICYSYCRFLKDKETQIMQYFPPNFREQYRTLDSISYQLRRPEDSNAVKFKTRIRFGKSGLELEKRHPDQKNWTRVCVDHLPPVDLDPVPHPVASHSPPLARARNRKRLRSPQQSKSPSAQEDKRGKVEEPIAEEIEYSLANVEESFEFKNLVEKFASK